MAKLSLSCNWMTLPALPIHPQFNQSACKIGEQQRSGSSFTAFATKSGGFSFNSLIKRCQECGGKGAIECPGCKGTGKNKKNGNIFERWKIWVKELSRMWTRRVNTRTKRRKINVLLLMISKTMFG
ncbi:hypothetical protein F0562_028274 [Nyssa sinensis]|uniref:CR-type domain-containing protein n=1 Tax=Nyssa sinensis TaxID=561372 RepID=A0A5J5B8K0_9ASTE|nr:hypothetical protein F0562_028274 [Nyssa sinensis]